MTSAQVLVPLALALSIIFHVAAHAASTAQPGRADKPGMRKQTAAQERKAVWRGVRPVDKHLLKPSAKDKAAVRGGAPPSAKSEIKARLNRKSPSGWSLSGGYSRNYSGTGNTTFARYGGATPSEDVRPLNGTQRPRPAVVITLSRSF